MISLLTGSGHAAQGFSLILFPRDSPFSLIEFIVQFSDVRIEEFLYEKLEKKVPTRMNNHEVLGQSMIESGSEFGPGTAYGE